MAPRDYHALYPRQQETAVALIERANESDVIVGEEIARSSLSAGIVCSLICQQLTENHSVTELHAILILTIIHPAMRKKSVPPAKIVEHRGIQTIPLNSQVSLGTVLRIAHARCTYDTSRHFIRIPHCVQQVPRPSGFGVSLRGIDTRKL